MDKGEGEGAGPHNEEPQYGLPCAPSGALRAGRVVLCTGYTALRVARTVLLTAHITLLVPLLAGAVDGESYRHEDEGEGAEGGKEGIGAGAEP
jgi:hypothetical protein